MESAVNRQLLTEEYRNRINKSNRLRELLQHHNGNSNGNGDNGLRHVPGRTLGSVLNIDNKSSSANRTLLDIIREDSGNDNKKTWNYFKDKLRLKRAGAAWTSSLHIPASDLPMEPNNSINNRMMMRRQSTRIPVSDPDPLPGLTDSSQTLSRRSSLLQRNLSCIPQNNREQENAAAEEEEEPHAAEEGEEEDEGIGETAEEIGEVGPVRMSLMSLLAETDREMGIEGSNSLYMIGDEEDEEEEEEGGDRNGGEYSNCCVCMVRHKGAAFIPCGHTFCRLCSRELWVQRGNCPLCNGYILEILDIF